MRLDFADLEDVPLRVAGNHQQPLIHIHVAALQLPAAQVVLGRLGVLRDRRAQLPEPPLTGRTLLAVRPLSVGAGKKLRDSQPRPR
jgi:hypothetical protein